VALEEVAVALLHKESVLQAGRVVDCLQPSCQQQRPHLNGLPELVGVFPLEAKEAQPVLGHMAPVVVVAVVVLF
jgi:hypothetical protein